MDINKKRAFQLIFLFGMVSLFGDIIYEGARGVNGPYMQTLGASAAMVGLVVGVGEFLGYGLRLLSGYLSDKTKAPWFFTILGYILIAAVPLLSLASVWQYAALFIILERVGKGLRSPARDTLASHASKKVGTGLGFGILEFMDQIGAVIGPLLFMAVFLFWGTKISEIKIYQQGYRLFWIPFVFLLLALFVAYKKFKQPQELEIEMEMHEQQKSKISASAKTTSKIFWLYILFAAVTTTGFANFALVGYHLKQQHLANNTFIPLLYALAMVVDAFAGIYLGKMYDVFKAKKNNPNAGLLVLGILPLITAIIPVLTFSFSLALISIGTFFWGIVMGAHETLMRSAVADLSSIKDRATSYGIFNVIYGGAWLIGSFLTGVLYDYSRGALILTFVAIQIFAIPLFLVLRRAVMK